MLEILSKFMRFYESCMRYERTVSIQPAKETCHIFSFYQSCMSEILSKLYEILSKFYEILSKLYEIISKLSEILSKLSERDSIKVV